MSSDQIWSLIGKFLAIIGGIAALIKIIEWISSPRQKLIASVESVPFELPEPSSSKLSGFHSMWIISMRNKGKKPCDGISLVLPNAELARISRVGAVVEYRKLTDGAISLGSLNPSESVALRAWASWGFNADNPTKVRLSHNAGIGTIAFHIDIGT
jgi:hypothetical protein